MTQRRSETEIELVLRVAPGAIRRLAAHRLLRGRARAVKRRLHGIYYDTLALDLWRQGISLRVRREGGRWVQTMKGGGAVRAGLHERTEIEAPVAGPELDLSHLRAPAFAAAFESPEIRSRLKPVFVTEITRTRRLIAPDDETLIEASIDHGVIRSGDRAEPVAELELELKRGKRWHLYELALKLLEDVPVAVENRSKAARGFALRDETRAAPVKTRSVPLTSALSAQDAFKVVMWANFAHLQDNERGLLEETDPEYLHQMRVAVRRLRSALSVFSPPLPATETAPLAAELKWLASRLGPARDWDVFLTESLPAIEGQSGARGVLKAFRERCQELRRNANAAARRAVRSSRYQRLVLRLAGWLAAEEWFAELDGARSTALRETVTKLAATVLEKRYQQARKRGRRLARRSPAELHRLRIAIKKFRYATDFFASLYEGKAARESMKHLGRLQDILGAMNDAATVAGLMAQGFRGARGKRVLEAKEILLGWSRGRAVTLHRDLKGAWKAFRAAEKFW